MSLFAERLSLSRSISIELLPSLRRSTRSSSSTGEPILASEAVASCVGRAAATLQLAVEVTATYPYNESQQRRSEVERDDASSTSALSAVASLLKEDENLIFSDTSPIHSSSAVSSTSTLASDRQLTQKAMANLVGMRHFGTISTDTGALRSWLAVLLLERLRMSADTLASILRIPSQSLPRFLESADSCFFSLDLQGTGSLGLQELCVLLAALITPSKHEQVASMALSDASLFLSSAASLSAIIASPNHPAWQRGDKVSPKKKSYVSEGKLLRAGESTLLQRMGFVSLPIWRSFLAISCSSEKSSLSPTSFKTERQSEENEMKTVIDLKDNIERACAAINNDEVIKRSSIKRYGLHELWSQSCNDACVASLHSVSSHSSTSSSSNSSRELSLMKSAAQNMDVASCAHQALLASLVVVGGGALMAVAREGRDPLDESSIGSVTTSVVACLGMIPNEALISSKLTDLDSSDISQKALVLASNIAHSAVLGAIRSFINGLPSSIALAMDSIEESMWQGQEADTSANVTPSLPSFAIEVALNAAQRAVNMKNEKVHIVRNNNSYELNTQRHPLSLKKDSILNSSSSFLSSAQLSSNTSQRSPSTTLNTSGLTSKLSVKVQPLQPLGTWEAPPRSPLPTLSPSIKEKKIERLLDQESGISDSHIENNEEKLNTSLKFVNEDLSSTTVPTLMISIDELIEAEEEATANAASSTLKVPSHIIKNVDVSRKKSIDVDPSIYTIDDACDVFSLSVINSVGEAAADERADNLNRQTIKVRDSLSSTSILNTNSSSKSGIEAPVLLNDHLLQPSVSLNHSSDEIDSLSKLRKATEIARLPPQASFSSPSLPSTRSPTDQRSVLGEIMSPNRSVAFLKSPNDDETEDAPLEFQPIRLPNPTASLLSSSSSLGLSPPQRGSQLSGSRLSTRGLSMSSLAYSPQSRKEVRRDKGVTPAQSAAFIAHSSQSSIPPHLLDEYHSLLVRQARLLDRILDPNSTGNDTAKSEIDSTLTREGLLLALRVVRDRVKAIDSLAVSNRGQHGNGGMLLAEGSNPEFQDRHNPFSSPPGQKGAPSVSAVDISRFFPKSPAGTFSSTVGVQGASRGKDGATDVHRLDVDNGEELLMRITSRLPSQPKKRTDPSVPPLRSHSRSWSDRIGQNGSINKRANSVGSTRVHVLPSSIPTQGAAHSRGRSHGQVEDVTISRNKLHSSLEKNVTGADIATIMDPHRSRSRSRSSAVVKMQSHLTGDSQPLPRARSRSRESFNHNHQKPSSMISNSLASKKEKVTMKGRGRALNIASISNQTEVSLSSSSPRQLNAGDSNSSSRPTPRSSEALKKSPGRLLWRSIFPVDEPETRLPPPPSNGWASAIISAAQRGDTTPISGAQSHVTDNFAAPANSEGQAFDSNGEGFILTPPAAPVFSSSSSSSSSSISFTHSSLSSANVQFPAFFSSPSAASHGDSSSIKQTQNQLQHQQQVSAYMSHPRLRRFMRDGHLIGSSPPTAPVPPPAIPPRKAHGASASSIDRLHSGLPTNPRKGK